MRDDIEYRIRNLKESIRIITEDESDHDDWDAGYKEGKLQSQQSELRFLQGILWRVENDF